MIAYLGARYEAPLFAPHITLFSGSAASESSERWPDLLADLARGLEPFKVTASPADTSEDFFKTVYLPIEPAPTLALLHERFRDAMGAEPTFRPHLSLMYKSLPPDYRRQIADAVDKADPWICDRLAVVTSGPDGWRDIAWWRRLCTHVIGGVERAH